MNFVPCLAWVPRGKAASTPQKLQLSPDELKRLLDETKELSKQDLDEGTDEDEEDKSGDESDLEDVKKEFKRSDDDHEEDDFDTKYNMDSYDNDDEENPLFKISDIAVHVDNHDDDYLTDQESEGDVEEKEDYQIKDSDNILISGHVEDSSSVLEIHVYNQEEDAFYVHHDIVLPSYPLCLAWLDFHPADETPGNYVAVGDMSPVIKIYDLDIVDVLEPDFKLGKEKKKDSKKKTSKYHTDAVISLSWNKNVRNLLASGSADSSVIVWDLNEGTVLNKLLHHSNKVQTLEWHPTESQFLLSGCTDGFIKLYDCQSDDESKSWKIDGEIEKVVWDVTGSFRFFCSTDQGCIYEFDIRKEGMEREIQAHKEAVTGLDISPLRPDILISASMDKTLKVWDLSDEFKMIKSLKVKVGSIHAAKVAPDLDLTVAIGGDNASNSIKVMDIFKSNEDSQKEKKFRFEDTKIKSEDIKGTQNSQKKNWSQRKNNFRFDGTKVKSENIEANQNVQALQCSSNYETQMNSGKKRKIYTGEGREESKFQTTTNVDVASKHIKQKDFRRKK